MGIIEFIEAERLNEIEVLTPDGTDVEQVKLDPETYLNENYETIINLYGNT